VKFSDESISKKNPKMSATEQRRWKYPRTHHLMGSEVVDDDKSVSTKSLQTLLDNEHVLVVQEKVDGANVGVHFVAEWQVVLLKRAGEIGQGEKPQYEVFRQWVYENMELLWRTLGTDYVAFGEWLWQRHAVEYDDLPSHFLCFDVLEKSSERFLSQRAIDALLIERNVAADELHRVPCLATLDAWPRDFDAFVAHTLGQSRYGKQIAEGLYVRVENQQHVIDRVKYRRKTFVSGRTDFNSNMVNNSLSKKS
jgi:RNA ligase